MLQAFLQDVFEIRIGQVKLNLSFAAVHKALAGIVNYRHDIINILALIFLFLETNPIYIDAGLDLYTGVS